MEFCERLWAVKDCYKSLFFDIGKANRSSRHIIGEKPFKRDASFERRPRIIERIG